MKITYTKIRQAMKGKSYSMSLVSRDAHAVIRSVNQGIDAHLEACFIKGKDVYESKGGRLECLVSPKSLPVLLRRLSDDEDETAQQLAGDILDTLGFNVESAVYTIVKR